MSIEIRSPAEEEFREAAQAVYTAFGDVMHDEDLEQTRVGRFLGVPGHVYRQLASSLLGWIGQTLRGDRWKAFAHEVGLRSNLGFIQARWHESLRGPRRDGLGLDRGSS